MITSPDIALVRAAVVLETRQLRSKEPRGRSKLCCAPPGDVGSGAACVCVCAVDQSRARGTRTAARARGARKPRAF